MVEDIMEEVNTVTMLVYINGRRGLRVFSKTVDEEDVIKVLYIPVLDLSVYSNSVGTSPSGIIYKKFLFNIMDDEDFLYREILDSFFSSGWSPLPIDEG
jgi:hypothetical protein